MRPTDKRALPPKRQRRSTAPQFALPVPRLVRREGAAAYLSVSVPTIDQMRLKGEIVPVPMPATHNDGVIRTVVFDLRDLDAVIDRWKKEDLAR